MQHVCVCIDEPAWIFMVQKHCYYHLYKYTHVRVYSPDILELFLFLA